MGDETRRVIRSMLDCIIDNKDAYGKDAYGLEAIISLLREQTSTKDAIDYPSQRPDRPNTITKDEITKLKINLETMDSSEFIERCL